ncbi:heterokaryon incompatibility protein-domain-containing protein [Aspergillus transmontanensis]|uniref:Heterokaryon incompatibility protein-domain-containing protein n=1 Tax=Aspergillus transmontanensis TaxID=1034304 RepID=A0A5N6W2U5_9EURO|nr:heterokaryon incompatibility protein-domain-containing protein [Aspergillus transmontanensis]
MVRGSWFPTRLLHLVRDSHGILVKLIISKEASIRGRRYMTLSHRWPINADHRLMLTKSTFEQLQRGIDYRKLPRSFQESMELACCLGVNYIWIDSLCIHQDKDDLSDWEKEAVTMHKVYSHSFLNISATFSYDGTESLFNRPNTWTTTRPTQVKVNVNGTPRHAHLIPGDIWNDEITDAPLNKRGWVFQERFLARRVLHFGRSQLAWECCEWEALEMFPNGVPFTFIAGSNSKSSVIAARNRIRYKPCLNSNHKASMALYDSSTVTEFIKWRNGIVEDYSKCQFTFYRDKLVAFGGVARSNILTLDSPDRYIVGMWERSMIYDLAWQRIHTMALSPPARQTQELHVPSWSWASFRGEVVFPHILPTKSMSHFATLVDIIGTPDQELQVDQGSFKGVSLQLECFVFEISLLPSDDEEINGIKLNQFNMVFMQENAVLEDSVGTVIDLDKDDPSIPRGKTLQMLAQEGRLFLVPLYATFNLRAMIVARLGHTGRTYCRLGAFEVAIYWESFEPTDIGQSSRQPGWGANLQAVGLKSFMDKTPKVLNGNAHYQRIEII